MNNFQSPDHNWKETFKKDDHLLKNYSFPLSNKTSSQTVTSSLRHTPRSPQVSSSKDKRESFKILDITITAFTIECKNAYLKNRYYNLDKRKIIQPFSKLKEIEIFKNIFNLYEEKCILKNIP